MPQRTSGRNSSSFLQKTQTTQSGSSASKRLALNVVSPLGKGRRAIPRRGNSAKRPQVDFSQLPVEMVREIILNATSSGDLCALSLVCKAFHEWVTPRLYETVFLSSTEQIICFSSTLSRKPVLGCFIRDLYGDNDGRSPWIPKGDDASTGSTSDESDSEMETELSDTEDLLNCNIHHLPGSPSQLAILIHPRENSPQPSPSTVLQPWKPNERHTMHPERKLFMELLTPMIKPTSVVYVHACTIMGSCPSLRTLYLPWSNYPSSSCLRALWPFTRLQELAVHKISELGINFDNLESASILIDFSSVQRLTILNMVFEPLSAELPNILPALTHLRICLNVSADMATCLSRFPRLTHLWFTPHYGEQHSQADIEAFLIDVQTRCHRIERVRIDFPPSSTDPLGTVNWQLNFPFVRIRSSPLRDAPNLWADGRTYPFYRDESSYMYNLYAECIEHYWRLKLNGGGWDD